MDFAVGAVQCYSQWVSAPDTIGLVFSTILANLELKGENQNIHLAQSVQECILKHFIKVTGSL